MPEPYRPDAPNQQLVRADGSGPADERDPDAPPPEPPAGVTPAGGYDPSGYTVADVEAYVAEHPDQREHVLALEVAGKNRSTLIDALTRLAEPQE